MATEWIRTIRAGVEAGAGKQPERSIWGPGQELVSEVQGRGWVQGIEGRRSWMFKAPRHGGEVGEGLGGTDQETCEPFPWDVTGQW